jgi:hypothetical protein
LSQVDINKKYNNFLPKKPNYGVQASAITVEEVIGVLPKFNFVVNDPQLLRKSTGLFDLKKNVLIKMGYANTLETVVEGEIAAIKSISPLTGRQALKCIGKQKTLPTLLHQQTINPFLLSLMAAHCLASFS